MAILIDSNFPGGNIILEGMDGNNIRLRQDLRDTEGHWFYWCFRVRGAAGKSLNFHFSTAKWVAARGPAVSLDQGESWRWLGAESVSGQCFSYTFPKDADDVRFSFALPYQQSHLERFLSRYKSEPHLRKETLCVTRKGRLVERLRLNNPSSGAKRKVIITARHHCCEMIANYAIEGIIETALSDSDAGRWYRSAVDLAVIPFVDKDGVEDGDQGKNRRPRDHGRDYAPPHVHVETEAIIRYVDEWSPGGMDIALDLHCPYIRGTWNENIYVVGGDSELNAQEERAFVEILANAVRGPLPFRREDGYLPFGNAWNIAKNYSQGMGFKRWSTSLPNTRLSCSFELPYANVLGAEVTADAARAFGRDLADAMRQYLSR